MVLRSDASHGSRSKGVYMSGIYNDLNLMLYLYEIVLNWNVLGFLFRGVVFGFLKYIFSLYTLLCEPMNN